MIQTQQCRQSATYPQVSVKKRSFSPLPIWKHNSQNQDNNVVDSSEKITDGKGLSLIESVGTLASKLVQPLPLESVHSEMSNLVIKKVWWRDLPRVISAFIARNWYVIRILLIIGIVISAVFLIPLFIGAIIV